MLNYNCNSLFHFHNWNWVRAIVTSFLSRSMINFRKIRCGLYATNILDDGLVYVEFISFLKKESICCILWKYFYTVDFYSSLKLISNLCGLNFIFRDSQQIFEFIKEAHTQTLNPNTETGLNGLIVKKLWRMDVYRSCEEVLF